MFLLLFGFMCMFSGLFLLKLKLCLVIFSCGDDMLRLNSILFRLLVVVF